MAERGRLGRIANLSGVVKIRAEDLLSITRVER
jgi:hypothetical protein